MKNTIGNHYTGFTIVELLVVIVVIGVLAAITVVSYTGISQKAVVSSLRSDLSNDSKLLKMYQAEYGAFPSLDANNCPTSPADNRYCLKLSPGNSKHYYINTASTFTFVAKNGTNYWSISDDTSPVSTTSASPLESVTISGYPYVEHQQSRSAVLPAGATYTFQWQRSSSSNGTYTNIPGQTLYYYSITLSDVDMYLRLAVTGNGQYFSTVYSANSAKISAWIDGRSGTAMAGKQIYYKDTPGDSWWKTSTTSCSAPQCVTGLDANYVSNYALVSPISNPVVDFSAYPAQNACKAVGGRLPYTAELLEIAVGGKAGYYYGVYGNSPYPTATEYSATMNYIVYFPDGVAAGPASKNTYGYIKCIKP